MPLFKKSQNKGNLDADNTTPARNDPKFSGSGADPNFMGYNQSGPTNDQRLAGYNPPQQQPNIQQSGYPPQQQSYPNEADNSGMGYPNSQSKPSRFSGKVESAIGTIVGSDSLRAKGMQKEREARTLNTQSNELAQAESLEREAQMHRDRAMRGGVDSSFMDSSADRRFNY